MARMVSAIWICCAAIFADSSVSGLEVSYGEVGHDVRSFGVCSVYWQSFARMLCWCCCCSSELVRAFTCVRERHRARFPIRQVRRDKAFGSYLRAGIEPYLRYVRMSFGDYEILFMPILRFILWSWPSRRIFLIRGRSAGLPPREASLPPLPKHCRRSHL